MLLIAYGVIINIFTYWLYWVDKQRAREGDWRIPEASLLLAGLLGGTPAAFIAQRKLRHKNRKISFQLKFWLSVVVQAYLLTTQMDWLRSQLL